MKILILGAGAVGGYFGGRFTEAGIDTTFLTRSKRAEFLNEKGLTIKSALGNGNYKVKTILSKDIKETYDYIILTCKAYSLEEAINDIKPAIGKNTYILPLTNGLKHYEILGEKIGKEKIIRGFCFVNSKLSPEGEIIHASKLQKIVFGGHNESTIKGCNQFEEIINATNLDYVHTNDIMQDLWEKFVFITSAASITCLMRSDIGTILKSPYGKEITLEIFDECLKIADKSGYKLRKELEDRFYQTLTNENLSMKTSLLSDIENNNLTEVDHIIGSMIDYAKKVKTKSSMLKIAYCHIKNYELNLNK